MKTANYVLLFILIAFIPFVVFWYFTPVQDTSINQQIGGSRDEYGCLTAAGYTFNDKIKACARQFEMTPDIEEAARLAVAEKGEGYALTVVSFVSYEEAGSYTIRLERGEERTAEVVNIRGGKVVEIVESTEDELIRVSYPEPEGTVSSPVLVQGEARGYWFFEASFPLIVVDWDGRIIGEGYATAEGEWMTEEFVPFSGEVEYSLATSTPYRNGAIIFKKDNPSGLPEHDAAVEVPVVFE